MQKKWLIAIPLILILMALCAVIAVVGLFALNGIRSSGFSLPVVAGSLNYSAEEMEESLYTVNSPAQLAVENISGKVRVEKGSGNTITVESKKTTRGLTQQAASANLDRLDVIITQKADAVEVRVEVNQVEANWNGQVDFVITVPEETDVQVSSKHGDLFLSGTRGTANLNTTFGAVTVMDVGEGSLTVSTRNGRVEARTVKAGSQKIDLKSSFGDVILRDAKGGDVAIESNNGKLTLEEVEASGTLHLSSDFGRIDARDSSAGTLNAKTQNGEIALSVLAVTGQITANSDFGAIRLEEVRAEGYTLETLNGSVRVDGAAGLVSAHSDFGDVVVENAADTTLNLRSKNGAVRFDGSLGAGPHNLQSDFGAVEMRLPADTPLNLDLKTNFGKIQTEFEMSLSGMVDKEHLVGKINGGGDLLTATTKSGNITIEIRR